MGKSLIIPGADFSANGIKVGNIINVVVGETIPFNVYLLPTAADYEIGPQSVPTVPNDAVTCALSDNADVELNAVYASILVGQVYGDPDTENKNAFEVVVNYNRALDVRQAFMCIDLETLDLSGVNFGNNAVDLSKFCACSSIHNLIMPEINVSNMKFAFYNLQAPTGVETAPFTFGFIKKVTGTMESAFEYFKYKFADFSGIDVSSVTAFTYCFRRSYLEVIDLSTWHIDSATNISGMFYNCSKLKTLHLDNFNCQPTYAVIIFSGTTLLEKVFVTNCSSDVKTNLLSKLNEDNAGGSSNWTESTVDGKACLVKGS